MTAVVKAESIGRVLASALQARRQRGSLIVWGVLLVLALALPVLAWVLIGPEKGPKIAGVLTLVLLSALTLSAWAMLTFNVLQQNQPGLACLLPGHVATLRRTLQLVTGALVVAGAAVSWAVSDHVTPGLVIAGLACGFIAAGFRWPAAWLLLALPGWTLPWIGGGSVMRATLALWMAWPVLCNSVLLVALWAVLRATVGTGSERHVRAHARLQVAAVVMRGQIPQSSLARPGSGSWLWAQRLGWRSASAWTDAVLRRGGSLDARLPLGLGPQAHLGGLMGGMATGAVMTVLFLSTGVLLPQWETGVALRGGVLWGLVLAALMVGLQAAQALHASRREQALLRLLPGSPQGPALNRWLARHLTRQVVVALLTYGAVLAVVQVLFETPAGWRWSVPLLYSGLLLAPWTLLALWRDWSRAGQPAGLSQVGPALGLLAALGLSAASIHTLGRAWWELPLLANALLLPLLVWRWRRLDHLPAAWPVGRLRPQAATETSR